MNLGAASTKWILGGLGVITLATGFVLGRLTSGSDATASDFATNTNTDSSVGSRVKSFFGGNDAASGGSNKAYGPSGMGRSVGQYTKESFIEATQSLSLFSGGGPKKMREMLAIQESLAQQDVHALVRELIADGSPEARQALYLAMGVLAEQSPTKALDLVLAQPENMQQGFGIFQAVAASMEKDPDGTLARLRGIENKMLQQRAISSAINAIAQKDPQRALDLYLEQEMAGPNDHSVHTIFYQWARKDPAAAAASLERIKDMQKRAQARNGLVNTWMQSDPEAAWEWVKTQPGTDNDYQDPRFQALTAWAATDPDAALAAAQSLPANLRDKTLPQMIGRWAQNDPAGALKAAESLPEELKHKALPQVISNWARTDPEAALAWVAANDDLATMEDAFRNLTYSDAIEPQKIYDLVMEKMPAGRAFQNTVSQVISRWAQKDPVAAAAALKQMPPGDAFNSSAGNLVRAWSKNDPAAAFGWAASLPEGSGKNDTIRNWFSYVADDHPELAVSYYRQLDAQQQKRVTTNLVSSLVKSDPSAAITFSNSLNDDDLRKRARESIASSWAYEDPQQASRWAVTLPEAEKSQALQNVVDSWANKNLEAAAEWLASMPASPALDEATSSLSRKLVGVDPEAAMSWAGSITDEKKRQRALYNSARQWIRNDPANGKAWVQRSNLTQEDKAKLLK